MRILRKTGSGGSEPIVPDAGLCTDDGYGHKPFCQPQQDAPP